MILHKNTLRAVAFDMDGLMFNTEMLYEEVGDELLRRRGKSVSRDLLDQMMGRPSRVALQIMIDWHLLEDTVPQLQQETEELFDGLLDTRLTPMPGLLELLDALHAAQVPKAITTSSRRFFVDRVLGISGLEGNFQFILSSEDVQDGKPAPEIYQKAARRFKLRSCEMMVLEDSENGVRSAVAAGAHVVAVPGQHSRRHDFNGAALVADSLQDHRIWQALSLNQDSDGTRSRSRRPELGAATGQEGDPPV